MENSQVKNPKIRGLNANGIRIWGLLFLTLGVFGRGVLQTQLLGVGQVSAQQLLEIMQSSQNAMILATVSLVFQAIEACAAPIFVLLLVEGFCYTSNALKYFLRVLTIALLSEIPYNLVTGAKVIDGTSRNPVFALVLGFAVLYFFKRYEGTLAKNILIKIAVTVAGLVWALMLGIDSGLPIVLLIATMYLLRRKHLIRNFLGSILCIVCMLFNPFFVAAPMGFLVIHFYNGEKGEPNRIVNYLYYPILLLAIGLFGIIIF